MVLYCAADLLWATRIREAAGSLGIPCRPVRTVEMLEARLADSAVRGLIVDLDIPDAALALVRRLRDERADVRARAIRIAAFGPHVATDLFDRAKAAGVDAVLARGVLDRRLREILTHLNSPPGASPSQPHASS
jgi:hypothetical protein